MKNKSKNNYITPKLTKEDAEINMSYAKAQSLVTLTNKIIPILVITIGVCTCTYFIAGKVTNFNFKAMIEFFETSKAIYILLGVMVTSWSFFWLRIRTLKNRLAKISDEKDKLEKYIDALKQTSHLQKSGKHRRGD